MITTQSINDMFTGKEENYILPFSWQPNTDAATLRRCLADIHDLGAKAVCLKANPHSDFLGSQWWQDLDILMEEAQKHNMRIWIMDDFHVPNKHTNKVLQSAPDNLKRWILSERQLLIEPLTSEPKLEVIKLQETNTETLIAVIAGKQKNKNESIYFGDLQDLTDKVTEDGCISPDFLKGNDFLFVYTKRLDITSNNILSFLDRDSVKFLLDTIYEPHYEHYKEVFGNTFAGFVSDESECYNLNSYKLGKIGTAMSLPWNDQIARQFYNRSASGKRFLLPGLFHNCDGLERTSRFIYMDVITRMYQKNFSLQIGNWCKKHGVEYIGHTLEDRQFQFNLDSGTGYYFRAIRGQHMSGIGITVNDLLPDRDEGDGYFFHYELPVLAASAACQNPWTHGRALGELIAASDLSQNPALMKWMADCLLGNGINYFVPHILTDSTISNTHCSAQFSEVLGYMNRMSHLFNGGQPKVDVAVFYPAEGSWSGTVESHVARLCIQNQIPYHSICMDTLMRAEVTENRIVVGTASYSYLFVDSVEYLPESYIPVLQSLIEQGVKVYCVNFAPTPYTERASWDEGENNPMGLTTPLPVISEDEILPLLEEVRLCKTSTFEKWLRCYQYEQNDWTALMFFNASMQQRIETKIKINLSINKTVTGYDAFHQKLFTPLISSDGTMQLSLDCGQSFVLLMEASNNE